VKKIRTYRTRFKKDIVAEWLLPVKQSNKVLILCDGLPVVPGKNDLLDFFSKQGYWVFYPRYRGSWESGGSLLARSPHLDIIDVIDGLFKKIENLHTGQKYIIKKPKIFLLGSSFGGSAVILTSQDKRVTAGVAFSPVVDWQAPSQEEPLEKQYDFLKAVYGMGYRLKKSNWDKLIRGNFYNPIKQVSLIDGRKLMIIHSQDDKVVRFKDVKKFVKQIGANFYPLKRGGHLSARLIIQPVWFKKIKKFFKV